MFAFVQSQAFQTWVRMVGGRLKSDPTITADLAYNAFPWPVFDDGAHKRLADAAQEIDSVRAKHPDATLADLYDPLSMPADLVRVHTSLDKLVDGMYGWRKTPTEAERAARLFTRYSELCASESGMTLSGTGFA
jgi:hypothetical protein